MTIYLVHHGRAVSPEVDAQRPLSGPGRAAVDHLAKLVAARGTKPAAIWHSGKLRARQTAEAFLRECNPLAEYSAIRGLQPDDPPEWIRDIVSHETRDVMLVGHMPHLPRLLTLLVTGSADSSLDFPLHGAIALTPKGGARFEELWKLEG